MRGAAVGELPHALEHFVGASREDVRGPEPTCDLAAVRVVAGVGLGRAVATAGDDGSGAEPAGQLESLGVAAEGDLTVPGD